MISKELFTEVYSEPYMLKAFPDKPSWIRWYANQFDVIHDIAVNVNIYELAHKCKEWAATLGFNISSNLVTTMLTSSIVRELFVGDTEPEAIFKACQWILDNQK